MKHLYIPFILLLITGCTSSPTLPTDYSSVKQQAPIYPDYRDITIPVNIAPLNVWVQDSLADEVVVQIGDMTVGTDSDGKTDIDAELWRSLLAKNAGGKLVMQVYAHRQQGWVRFSSDTIHVASEPIDSFLSYRLIEPGYELYRQLGLYQRDLTSFDEFAIYENNRTYDDEHNHCVNCHNYQAYDTERMLFHVRAMHGGTMLIDHGNVRKIAIRHDSILAAGVYPSWHPTLPLVAFSTNKTGQAFHMLHPEKIEVIDEASDLLIYDAEHNTVRNLLRTDSCMETFPCWTPDGTRLYYCSARVPEMSQDNSQHELLMHYDSLFYNIYSMPFDPATRTFGEPRLEVDAASQGKSASVPRISPDGRWLLYTLGDYGQFHIWHKSARLWAKETDTEGLGQELFSQHGSYHTWSSNGRWIVFSSRQDDGNFTRPYICYFDNEGKAHRPFMLPQRDPESNLFLLKSYNVPELSKHRVPVSAEELQQAVYNQQAITAEYESSR
ncbi:MAG: PD40 domain-containing protein [Bacteroidaceae bacterium]|nr:PD40 domain-containing protein [Bacteroidaceae bacterium]